MKAFLNKWLTAWAAFFIFGILLLFVDKCSVTPAFGQKKHYPSLYEKSPYCDNLVTIYDYNGHEIVIVGCSGDRCAFHSPDCLKCQDKY